MKNRVLGFLLLILCFMIFRSNTLYKAAEIGTEALSNDRDKGTLVNSMEVASKSVPVRKAHKIVGFPIISQIPELPTGCEVTALTMLLNYYGFKVDKETLAYQYLPTVPADIQHGKDGLLYGPDMERNFVGNPGGVGYICGTSAIVTAANQFLSQTDADFCATSMNRISPREVYELINCNIPVLAWVTIGMEPRKDTKGWYTADGEFMEWAKNDHGAVVIGYDETSVIIADSIHGEYSCDKSAFEEVFLSRGSKCVIIQNKKAP